MGEIKHEGQRNSQAPLDHIGERVKVMVRKFAFSDQYPEDGDPLEDLENYFPKGVVLGVLFDSYEGYTFDYDEDEETVVAYKPNGDEIDHSDGGENDDLENVEVTMVVIGY